VRPARVPRGQRDGSLRPYSWLSRAATFSFKQILHCTHEAEWTPVALSLGIELQGREADHSPPTSTGQDKLDLYSSIRLHGIVLNYALYLYLLKVQSAR
jgi:hypothetical protein